MATANSRKFLDKLFISKVRIKALKYFLLSSEPMHLRAIVRELNEEINAVRRELARLEEIGLIISEKKGNKKYFVVDPTFLFFDELLGMMHKSYGLGGDVVTNASKLGNMDFALLLQNYTKGKPYGTHNIDLVIIGDNIDMNLLDQIVSTQERRRDHEIHYTVISPRDFQMHKQRRDIFVNEIIVQEKVMLIGSEADFIVKPG